LGFSIHATEDSSRIRFIGEASASPIAEASQINEAIDHDAEILFKYGKRREPKTPVFPFE
jgi:hypothetical protein